MIEYLGNCSDIVDWDKFIAEIEKVQPMIGYQFDEDRSVSVDPEVMMTINAFKAAGYPVADKTVNSSIAWEAWYSGIHFDTTVPDAICKRLGIVPIDVSMVTKLIPGRFAPWHWDIRSPDIIEKFNSYNKPIVRVHIHMNKPDVGHLFMIDKHCFYGEDQGSMYQWPHWRAYHAGANCGITAKYQFSIIGVADC